MTRFHSAREAKEFLVSRIVEEAQRDNVVLTETERKMLYFSETSWTPRDTNSVSEEFDRSYDQAQYEKKIARLVRSAYRHARQGRDEYDSWWAAIRFLGRQDHYILVMIRQAGLRPRGDRLMLWGTGVLVAAVLVFLVFLSIFLQGKYGIDIGRYIPRRGDLAVLVCGTLICLFVGYQILRLLVGAKKADDFVSSVLDRFARMSNRMR
jgi:hypothetical protein